VYGIADDERCEANVSNCFTLLNQPFLATGWDVPQLEQQDVPGGSGDVWLGSGGCSTVSRQKFASSRAEAGSFFYAPGFATNSRAADSAYIRKYG
jgi:hypothetical protein